MQISKKLYLICIDYILILKKQFFKFIDRKDDHNLNINIGGGRFVRRHWKVLDFPSPHYNYPSAIIDYKHYLTSNKPFPFSDNSVNLFYSSHTFEHIPSEFCQYIFNEIYRCLKVGGAVRIVTPDFDLAYEAFGKGDIDFFKKYSGQNIEEKFLDFFATYMKDKVSPQDLQKNYKLMSKERFADFYTQQIPRDSQRKAPSNHINWWNYDKMSKMLIKAGFGNVYRSIAQGSRFSEMRSVGSNFAIFASISGFDVTHPELSLFVEAVK